MTAGLQKLALQSDKKKTPDLFNWRAMTEDEIRALRSGQHAHVKLNNGRVATVKINGSVRTWKRDLTRIEVPVKYGMYEYAVFDLTEAKARLLKLLEADGSEERTS